MEHWAQASVNMGMQMPRIIPLNARWLAPILLACCSCTNPFAPDPITPPQPPQVKQTEDATTPEITMFNLERAFNEQNKELYDGLLGRDFWFTESNCLGDVVFENGRGQEIELMFGPRDGSNQGIFNRFRTVEYRFSATQRVTELGRDYPIAFVGDPDGHPDEDWEVFRGRVQILLLIQPDEGNRVDQGMSFKLRRGDDGLWRIRRWIDDPLSGDCETGDDSAAKPISGLNQTSWGQRKQQ